MMTSVFLACESCGQLWYVQFQWRTIQSVEIAVALITIIHTISWWRIFAKSGRPRWAAFIPGYNVVLMFQVAGQPRWILILLLVPGINILVLVALFAGLADVFGLSEGKGYLMLIFFPISIPLLAFGSYQYEGIY